MSELKIDLIHLRIIAPHVSYKSSEEKRFENQFMKFQGCLWPRSKALSQNWSRTIINIAVTVVVS